jgi:hypothetical protein
LNQKFVHALKEAAVLEQKLRKIIAKSQPDKASSMTFFELMRFLNNQTAYKGGGKEKLTTEFPILEFEVGAVYIKVLVQISSHFSALFEIFIKFSTI